MKAALAPFIVILSFLSASSHAESASISSAIVKIRSSDPVLGTSAVASGLVFLHQNRGIVVTSEHAVLNSAIPSLARGIQYEIRFGDGSVTSAHYLVSDWGKGVTFLDFVPPSGHHLLTWENLRTRMANARGAVQLGGFPARSRQLQIQSGRASARSETAPPLADLDEMPSIEDSFAEYGMSGGAAWNERDEYVGLVSHVTQNGNVLLVPGHLVRDWTDSLLATGSIQTRLFKDSAANLDIYYSYGVSFTLNCLEPPCEMQFDLGGRKNLSESFPDSTEGTIAIGLQRLKSEEQRRKLPGDPYIGYSVVQGFRKRALRLDDLGRTPKIFFTEGPRFFQLLRDPSLIPIIGWQWSTAIAIDDRIERLIRELKTLSRDLNDSLARTGSRSRTPDSRRLIDPLQQAIERIAADISATPKTSTYYTEYGGSIVPQDFDVFFDPAESNAAWTALEILLPGKRSFYETWLKRIRRIFGEIALDPSTA